VCRNGIGVKQSVDPLFLRAEAQSHVRTLSPRASFRAGAGMANNLAAARAWR
jgi:hypothetical protein